MWKKHMDSVGISFIDKYCEMHMTVCAALNFPWVLSIHELNGFGWRLPMKYFGDSKAMIRWCFPNHEWFNSVYKFIGKWGSINFAWFRHFKSFTLSLLGKLSFEDFLTLQTWIKNSKFSEFLFISHILEERSEISKSVFQVF